MVCALFKLNAVLLVHVRALQQRSDTSMRRQWYTTGVRHVKGNGCATDKLNVAVQDHMVIPFGIEAKTCHVRGLNCSGGIGCRSVRFGCQIARFGQK